MTEQKTDHSFLEALGELVEAGIDLVTSSEAVAAVPVVGTAFKLMKGADDARAHLFAKKIAGFLREPNLERAACERMRKKMFCDSEEDRKLGQMLLMVLDKVTDFDKPALLAKVFASYLDQIVTRQTAILLINAIDASYSLDLEEFIKWRGGAVCIDGISWRPRLAATGLFSLYSVGAVGASGISYELSFLGKQLISVIEHCD